MADGSEALKAVQNATSDPTLAHNYRGQLAAALRVVEPSIRMLLACDYSEHVVWIYEEITHGDGGMHAAFNTVRGFLKGTTSIHDVARARHEVWHQFAVLRNSPLEGAQIAHEVVLATVGAVDACCQRQLEQADYYMYDKHLIGTESVAIQASYVTALYAAGRDWDAKDKVVRNAARKRGRVASDKETQWQIQRLLDYIGGKISTDNDAGDVGDG